MINADVHRLFPSIDITMKTRLNSRADLSKEKPPTLKGAMDEYFYQKYGESKQVRYINGMIVVPVAYCRTQIQCSTEWTPIVTPHRDVNVFTACLLNLNMEKRC